MKDIKSENIVLLLYRQNLYVKIIIKLQIYIVYINVHLNIFLKIEKKSHFLTNLYGYVSGII